MSVIFNRFAALGPRTGVGHYTAELGAALARLAPEEIEFFPCGLTWRLGTLWGAARPTLSRAEQGPAAAPAKSSITRSIKTMALHSLRRFGQRVLAHRFRKQTAQGGFALYHEPNFVPIPADLPTLATVHDLSVILHPEWHPAGRVQYYERWLPRSQKQIIHYVAVSEFTRQVLIRHLNVQPECVSTIPNGIRSDMRPLPRSEVAAALQRYDLRPGYLLHVGTIEPRKNLLMLMRAYCDLDAPTRSSAPLVLVGNWGWNSGEVHQYYQQEARHRGVRHVGYLSDGDLAALYNGARALVFPSFYEGFGLPPVEMAACGGAVLASTADAVMEVMAGGAHFIDSHDEPGWCEGMRRVIEDAGWQEHLRCRSLGVADAFTWQRCAADTLDLYRKLKGRGPQLPFAPLVEELRLSA